MEPTFFATPEDWRAWLAEHHATRDELLVGFHKVGSGRPSITWPESVDEALCFGWIDGVRRRLDDVSYTIRFTPRRPASTWSAVNIRRFGELSAEGRVAPAGEAAFAARRPDRSGVYAYEQTHRTQELSPEYAERLAADPAAAEFFSAQPPWYRRNTSYWVMSAKRAETRERRLQELITDSAAGRWIRRRTQPGQR
jgi:uncharacterized protein YdeI (YjbR/CyaY-like superfamily)